MYTYLNLYKYKISKILYRIHKAWVLTKSNFQISKYIMRN